MYISIAHGKGRGGGDGKTQGGIGGVGIGGKGEGIRGKLGEWGGYGDGRSGQD